MCESVLSVRRGRPSSRADPLRRHDRRGIQYAHQPRPAQEARSKDNGPWLTAPHSASRMPPGGHRGPAKAYPSCRVKTPSRGACRSPTAGACRSSALASRPPGHSGWAGGPRPNATPPAGSCRCVWPSPVSTALPATLAVRLGLARQHGSPVHRGHAKIRINRNSKLRPLSDRADCSCAT